MGSVFGRTAYYVDSPNYGRMILQSKTGERLCEPPHDEPLAYVQYFW